MSGDEYFDRRFRRWGRTPFGFLDPDFENMETMFEELFKEIARSMPKDLYRERKLPNGNIIREMGPFVYGYSMTVGPDGKPVVREFGNVKPSRRTTPLGVPRPSLEYREEREPLVDVIQDNGNIRVVAELPGVDKKDIHLHCTETILTIDVKSPSKKYHKEVELPSEVNTKTTMATYKNGVLEITLPKVTNKKPSGESIRIE